MKKRFDKFTIIALIFTLWYFLTSTIYILEYYAGIRLVTLVGESVATPIIWISTLVGLFRGEAHSILIAWSPILAVVIGAFGWNSRDQEGLYFIIMPCICLVAPLLMFVLQSTKIFSILYLAMPFVAIIALLGWVITDICIKKIEV